jgi:hypothetical protein
MVSPLQFWQAGVIWHPVFKRYLKRRLLIMSLSYVTVTIATVVLLVARNKQLTSLDTSLNTQQTPNQAQHHSVTE